MPLRNVIRKLARTAATPAAVAPDHEDDTEEQAQALIGTPILAGEKLLIDSLRSMMESHAFAIILHLGKEQFIDVQTAHALVKVYEAVNPANQLRFIRLPLHRLVPFAWRSVS